MVFWVWPTLTIYDHKITRPSWCGTQIMDELNILTVYPRVSGAGTARHRHLQKMAANNEISGSFCLTEISHGTNTKVILVFDSLLKKEIFFFKSHH